MTKEQLKKSFAYAGVTQAEIAKVLNISPQNFSNKLQRMSFDDRELSTIAEMLHAEYISCFLFADGVKI